MNNEVIYHTDCMLTLLCNHAVICLNSIKDKKIKDNVVKELTETSLNVHAYKILDIKD